MMLSAMFDKILLAGVSSSTNSIAPLDITGECAFIVFLAHVSCKFCLRSEGFVLLLSIARQILESICAILRAFLMRTYGEGTDGGGRISTFFVKTDL
jgi:hypothetical protein